MTTNAASSHLERELATQPADWRRAIDRLPEVIGELPVRGQRVAMIGCGTSWFIGQAYAALRESAGEGVTDAFAASEHRLGRGYDKVVLISRSGTTTEVVEVLEGLRESGIEHVAIVATAGTPIAGRARSVILMDEVDEQSVVQTRFATTTLAMLRASLGESLDSVIASVEAVLAEPAASSYGSLMEVEQISFVGRGWAGAVAAECALKLRESAQFWAESYPAMEYRHGPISIATAGRVVWALGEVPSGLAEQVRATGARFESREVDPMAELVRLHRFCAAKAAALGIDPDRPRHLSRSIILG